jgi:hypothetical protein
MKVLQSRTLALDICKSGGAVLEHVVGQLPSRCSTLVVSFHLATRKANIFLGSSPSPSFFFFQSLRVLRASSHTHTQTALCLDQYDDGTLVADLLHTNKSFSMAKVPLVCFEFFNNEDLISA